MPLSERSSVSISPSEDEGIGSMDSTDSDKGLGSSLKQTLFDFQAFNGQTKFKPDHANNVLTDQSAVVSRKNNTDSPLPQNSTSTDDDVVILDDRSKTECQDGKNADNNHSVTYPGTRPSSFAINDNIRNSFKDMISKIQTPSLGTLLSKTKYTCLNTKDKNPVTGGVPINPSGEKKAPSSGNLFDNLKEIQIESGTTSTWNSASKKGEVEGQTEVIDLDSSEEKNDTSSNTAEDEGTVDGGQSQDSGLSQDSGQSASPQDSNSQNSTEKACSQRNSMEEDSQDSGQSIGRDSKHSTSQDSQDGDMEVSQDSLGSNNSAKLDLTTPSQTQDSDSTKTETINCDTDKNVQLKLSDGKSVGTVAEGDAENGVEGRKAENDLLSFNSSELRLEKKNKNCEDDEMEEENELQLLSLDGNSGRTSDSPKGTDQNKTVKQETIKKEEGSDQTDVLQGVKNLTKEDLSSHEVKPKLESEESAEEETKRRIKSEILKAEIKSEEASISDNSSDTKNSVQELHQSSEFNVKSETATTNSLKKEDDPDTVTENLEASDAADNLDRKRPADSDVKSSEPKRSRLDMVIGKLGSQIGISPDALPMEEEDVSDGSVTDSTTESTTPTSAETEEEEESDSSPRKKQKRSIRISEKALENLLKAKIRSLLLSEKDSLVAELQKKIVELTAINEEWKSKARDLTKQIMDVTVLQQKHEKRKAKTAALKQISTKNVAVQAGSVCPTLMKHQQERQETTPTKGPATPTSPRVPGSTPPLRPSPGQRNTPTGPQKTTPTVSQKATPPVPQKATPRAPAPLLTPGPPNLNLVPPKTALITTNTKPAMIQQTSQGTKVQTTYIQQAPLPQNLITSPASVAPGTMNPTVKNLLDASKQIPPGVNTAVTKPLVQAGYIITSMPTSMVQSNAKPLSAGAPGVTAVNTVLGQQSIKFIDLTGEEEGNKGLLNSSRPVQIAGSLASMVGSPPVMVPANSLRHLQPNAQGLPTAGVLLSPTVPVASNQPQTFQLVFNSTSPAVRPAAIPNTSMATGVRTSAPMTSVTQPVRTPALLRQSVPQNTNVLRQTAPSNPGVTRYSSQNLNRAPANPVRPPPPLQSAPQNDFRNLVDPVTGAMPSLSGHPAPLPVVTFTVNPGDKQLPPKPNLKISRVSQGIVLSWNMSCNQTGHAEIKSYQLFAYQETSAPPSTSLWKKVGDVNALPLPMACTLTQFQEGNKYHFAVRPVDTLGRYGKFSDPGTIHLKAFSSKD